MADLIQFDVPSGARIGRAVRAVENMRPAARPLVFGPALQDRRPGEGRVIRMATFAGSWAKAGTKTVTLSHQTTTPNTYAAINLFANIGTATAATRNCAIARDGTAWYLIAAECV